MPIQKGPPLGKGMGGLKSMGKLPGPPVVRPLAQPLRVGANLRRVEEQVIRRNAARQVANQVQPERPRPAVRPAAPPLRVMPQKPAPVLKSLPKYGAPVPAAARPIPAGKPSGQALAAAGLAAGAGLIAVNAAAAQPELSAEVSALQNSLGDLQSRSLFGSIQSEAQDLTGRLNRVMELLESARQKGYAFQPDLETKAYEATGQWQSVEPQVMTRLQAQANMMQGRVYGLNAQVQGLNTNLRNPLAAAPALRTTQTQVNSLLSEVSRMESDLRQNYQAISSEGQRLESRLSAIHWALDQLDQAGFRLADGEDLVNAVSARWDKEGKEDPEGILFLSNRRLLFERKEKVATKKILFITTASELVQEVLIDQPLAGVHSSKAENKGLFGHQDFLLVQFAGANLGAVAFHLNGQDSKDWTSLIERCKSGQIEAERVSGTAGISVADLTRPLTPVDILDVQNQVNALQDEMMLKSSRQRLAELENDAHSLERKLAEVRARGYQVEKDLEADVAILLVQWERVKGNAEKTIESQARLLGDQTQGIQGMLSRLAGLASDLVTARPVYMQLKSAIASADAQADAAETTVQAQFDEYGDEVEGLYAHLEWVAWMLEALSTASFRLLATESGVAATEALYELPGLEPENGILFLTDQRLLWEDRVGTYELKVNVPMQGILDVKTETQDDGANSLVFQLGSGGPAPSVRFLFALPVADEWLKMIGRARSGGYTQDRATPLSQEELERVRNAPQQCSNCGAAHTAPILRGQTEIVCEYCGVVTRF